LQAPKGKLPKFAMQQIVPPMVVIRNDNPKLTAQPTVVMPPEIRLAMNNLPTLGDPMSPLPSGPPSNGTGSGGGIGSGNGGGVGSGEGPGVGPGRGGGVGGGIFRIGGGVSAPRPLCPDPDYSEEPAKQSIKVPALARHNEKSKLLLGSAYEIVATFGTTTCIDAAAVDRFAHVLRVNKQTKLLELIFEQTTRYHLRPDAGPVIRMLPKALAALYAACQVTTPRHPVLAVRRIVAHD
jgi:hypothetical protein